MSNGQFQAGTALYRISQQLLCLPKAVEPHVKPGQSKSCIIRQGLCESCDAGRVVGATSKHVDPAELVEREVETGQHRTARRKGVGQSFGTFRADVVVLEVETGQHRAAEGSCDRLGAFVADAVP